MALQRVKRTRAQGAADLLKSYGRSYRKNYDLFLLFIPVIVYYIIFHYMPMYGILIAFKKYNIMLGFDASKWVGFANFEKFFNSLSFWEVLQNTVLIGAYKIFFGFPTPIILALLLSEVRGALFKRTIQTISYLPHFLSWVVLAGIFTQFLSPHNGFVNAMLRMVGLEEIYFLGDPRWFRTTLVLTSIWQTVGWSSIIYLAAISGINPELYESAVIDGASRMQQVRFITLPSIMPTIVINLILTSGNIINGNFDQVFNLYNDAVLRVGDIIDTYVYRMGLVSLDFGYATAVGMFKMVIAFVLVMTVNAIARRVGETGIW